MARIFSTGIDRLDTIMGGVIPGDNIVLEVDSGAPVDLFLSRFFARAEESGESVVLVSFNHSPQSTLGSVPDFFNRDRLKVIDCFSSGKGKNDEVFSVFYERDPAASVVTRVADPSDSQELVSVLGDLEKECPGALYIFDSLTGMLELWGDESSVTDFFSYCCPRLYDMRTLAYWLLEKEAHRDVFLATVRHVTQVVLDIDVVGGRGGLTLRKCEGRPSSQIGVPHPFSIEKGVPVFVPGGREERELDLLAEIAAAIGEALVIDEMLESVMDVLSRRLGLTRGTIVLRQPATNELWIAYAHGLSPAERRRGSYKLGEGVTGCVAQTGEANAIPDIRKDPRFLDKTRARKPDEIDRPVSFICVPLRTEDGVLGALSGDRDFVSEEVLKKDLRLLSIVASIVSQTITINRVVAREKESILAQNVELRRGLHERFQAEGIVGASGAMREVLATVATVAPSNASVLVYGETGTGKELVARAIHYNSQRADEPFITLNCGALPDSLLESELFGHVRGAFTGAVEERKGRFELATGGTIFLDEVGDVSPRLQVRLLRVLQERQFERVGGSETIDVDVRIVAATNKDLEKEVREGRFREDLYYRLNVVPLYLPPLRGRREDIPLLVEHFLEVHSKANEKEVTKLSHEVLDLLVSYPWPGNVRELENAIERAVVMCSRGEITRDLLPLSVKAFAGSQIGQGGRPTEVGIRRTLSSYCSDVEDMTPVYSGLVRLVDEVVIRQALRVSGGSQRQAAARLGISRTTLRKKMKFLGFTGGPQDAP